MCLVTKPSIRFVSGNIWLLYLEERLDFVLPSQYAELLSNSENHHEATSDCGPYIDHGRFDPEQQIDLGKIKSAPIVLQKTNDGVILNPCNWLLLKRSHVVFVFCLYIWVTYVAGSVFAFLEPGIVDHFGVSVEASELGLALYPLAYGVGPLIFGPLTGIPIIGRNPVYYLTFIVFFALSFPAATINSFRGLLAIRFFAGFFGSVGIAIGGASIGDVFTLIYLLYGLGWWVLSFWAGPAIGPTFAGFAAMAKGWRWPLWEVVWICGLMAIFLLALTPETLTLNILLPFEITIKDPSIFFANLYTALTYAVYFTFFEVFRLTGLAFFACEAGSILALILYFAYLYFYMILDNIKNGFREQEHRLLLAIFGSLILLVGLFIFAWTARPSIHWIVPLIGVTIFVLASIFMGNDLIRSAVATGCILAARLIIMGIIGTLLMYKYGKTLCAKLKSAQA
ncbi:MFS general substrate transporter [Trichoderma novae-zelandiae]